MTQITRKIEFDAGHRVLGHESKCANLHGHRYVAEITVSAKKLDSISRVVDFSVIKNEVGGWIDKYWDHNMILNTEDPLVKVHPHSLESPAHHAKRFCGRDPYIMPDGMNPTAECMAEVLFNQAIEILSPHKDLVVVGVRLYETPNCWADYSK